VCGVRETRTAAIPDTLGSPEFRTKSVCRVPIVGSALSYMRCRMFRLHALDASGRDAACRNAVGMCLN
jgi:hypothetical protein